MKILALDTATEACSAALLIDGAIHSRYSEPKRGHAELILPMADELLAEAALTLKDLDCIAVGRGPGAFTGIRIGVAVAQGLAYGADLPIVPISDLAALAQRAADRHCGNAVVACIDARMNEVYWAAFTRDAGGLMLPYSEERVSAPDAVAVDWKETWIGAGTGWSAYAIPRAAGHSLIDSTLLPSAAEIARLAARDFEAGKAAPPAQAQPIYLRDKVASPPR